MRGDILDIFAGTLIQDFPRLVMAPHIPSAHSQVAIYHQHVCIRGSSRLMVAHAPFTIQSQNPSFAQ